MSETVKVTTPTKFTGERAGVSFVDGVGECSPQLAAVLAARFGYTVHAPQPDNSAQQEYDSNPDLQAVIAEAAKSPTVTRKQRKAPASSRRPRKDNPRGK